MTAQTIDSRGGERHAENRLVRTYSLGDMVSHAVVFMVLIAPMGIFSSAFQAAGGMVALVYAVGALVMMMAASSFGILAQAYEAAGSVFTYAGRAIAPWVGWLAGWMLQLDYILVPPLLSLVAAASMTAFLPWPAWVFIAVFVVVNTGINLRGIKTTRVANRVFLTLQAVLLIIFVVTSVAALASGAGRGFSLGPFYNDQFLLSVVGTGVSAASLSYLGYDALAAMAEDAKGGARQVGRAQLVSLCIVGVAFTVQMYLAALLVKDPAALIANGDPAGTALYDAIRVAIGPWLATLTALATALAWGIANNMVAQVAVSRLLHVMARDGALPMWLGKISVTRSVPARAILVTAGLSLLIGVGMSRRPNGITELLSLVTFGALISFIVVHLSVLVRNVRKGERRIAGFVRSWLLPVIGIASLAYVIINQNVLATKFGLAWLACGVVILLVKWARGRPPSMPDLDVTPAVGDAVVVGHRG